MNGSEAALVARVGVDLAKRVFQVHAVDRSGKVVLTKSMSPDRFLTWCRDLPSGCIVATEACGGAHFLARCLRQLGLDARLVAAHFVIPYRLAGKNGKNDVNDAAAICEAAGRPHMHFVPVKSGGIVRARRGARNGMLKWTDGAPEVGSTSGMTSQTL